MSVIAGADARTKTSCWLAGVFDNSMSVSVRFSPTKQSTRLLIVKTSRNPLLPLKLQDATQMGTIRTTPQGVRWCIENKQEARRFLKRIEPYSRARREEIQLLYRLTEPDLKSAEIERLFNEWEKYKKDMAIT